MVHDFADMAQLVSANNRASNFSDELVIAIIWKETNFDDSLKNKTSSATGLMQMTTGAVDDVNRNTPKGTHYAFSDMTNAALNIQCGTYYLDMIYQRSHSNKTLALNRYGTGPGYAGNLLQAETCLTAARNATKQIDPVKARSCLFAIHT